jgi:hypothetical protein
VLHQTGTRVSFRDGHCRFGRSMGSKARYFQEGSLSMTFSWDGRGTLPQSRDRHNEVVYLSTSSALSRVAVRRVAAPLPM